MSGTPSGKPDFAEVYDRCFSKVFNYLVYALGDVASADDAAGVVFERALDRFQDFDPRRGPVEAWLFGIARNAARDQYRARRLRAWIPLDLFDERPGRDPRSEDELISDESRRELARALAGLDARERGILALKFGADMTNRDIAAQEGLGESNVGVIVYRAVKKLQAALKEGIR